MLMRRRLIVLLAAVSLLIACGRPSHEPFTQNGLTSGMSKREAIAVITSKAFKVDDDLDLGGGYAMVGASNGKDLWLSSYCEGKLAITSALTAVNQEVMNSLIRDFTQRYRNPTETLATRNREVPTDPEELLIKEILDRQFDVTLAWSTPYGEAKAQFDHGADSLGFELTDLQLMLPCNSRSLSN
jgi:hypothetical protein